MANKKQYREIFDYLRGDRPPVSKESTVVFGRKDPLVAHAAGDLIRANLVDSLVISGGFGKDSGDLTIPEAEFLDQELQKDAQKRGFSIPLTVLETASKNGGDNARNSIAILNDANRNSDIMNAVAHATSARRLSQTLVHEGKNINGRVPDVYVKPTEYDFDPQYESDRKEARDELLRLADWPEQGMLPPQLDLPTDLVELARQEKADLEPKK